MVDFVLGTLPGLKREMRKAKRMVGDLKGLQSSQDEETHGESSTTV